MPRLDMTVAGSPAAHIYRRLTLVAHDAQIHHVNDPVFPPTADPDHILQWLKRNI